MPRNRKSINILFRNDDPCALSNVAHERRYLDLFAKYKIPQVVSVIPFMSEDPHNFRGTRFHELSENREIVEMLLEFSAKGLIEIAQHGTTHQTNHLHPGRETVASDAAYQGLGYKWLPFAPIYPEKGYSEFNGLDRNFVRAEFKRGRDHLEAVLRTRIETFTFPWGTLDLNALEALRDEGFKTALCGEKPYCFVKNLMALHNAREDVFEFAHELNNGKPKGPALYHVVLHSWMLKDHDLVELDKLLSRLAADDRVGFVTAKDLRQWPISFQMILAANHRVRVWGESANRHLGTPMQLPQRYDLNIKNYWEDFLKSSLVVLVFEKIGIDRSWILSGSFFLTCVLLWIAVQKTLGPIHLTSLVCSGGIFSALSVYKFKNQSLAADYWIKQGYQEVSSKAFGDPQNRLIADAFFRLFEQRPDPALEDREKYLQLKYFHSAKPWEALNELAGDYAQRGLNALAQMCYAESLRLNPGQTEVFGYIQNSENLAGIRKPVLSEDTCAISVIVLTNRFPRELKACLRSILANTFQDFEIIILNNNGPHEIQQVAESFADRRIVYKRVDKEIGLQKARNVAIQSAKGKYIAYLDDDDVFYPDHLETLYKAAENGKCRFVYANTTGVSGYLQGDEFYRKKVTFVWDSDFDRERFASRASIGNHAVLHEKSLFSELGLLNEELIAAEDEDFWLRCAAAMDLKHINRCTTEYRTKDNNITILNRPRNHFHGAIVRQFHAAFQGELARLKYLVNQRDRQRAEESLRNIRMRYLRGWFKSSFVLDELLPLIKYCGDRDFLRIVISDFCRLYKKGCIKSVIKHHAFLLLPMVIRNMLRRLFSRTIGQ